MNRSARTSIPASCFGPGRPADAALGAGPDVWEIIAALHAVRDETPDLAGEDLAAELVAVTGVGRDGNATVLRYYAAYPSEVEDRIEANRDTANREARGIL